MDLQRIDAYASTHHGLVTRAVAERLGMTASSWYRALGDGRLLRVSAGVARMPGAPRTREQLILAAVLGAGPGALSSHRSSAWLWGVERRADEPVDIVLGTRTARPTLPGVVVHRPTDLIELRPIVRRGIPTTSPLRMLVDLGAVDPGSVYRAMEAIVVNRTASPAAVVAVLERHARRGRHGVGALRDALRRYPFAVSAADSVLETRMADVARIYRLPPMTFHALVAGWEVDFLVDGTNVVIECDGRRFHEYAVDQFERDRRRDQELVEQGWIVVRVTWAQLTRAPAAFAGRLRRIIDRWAPA